jgi:hypothetical protein
MYCPIDPQITCDDDILLIRVKAFASGYPYERAKNPIVSAGLPPVTYLPYDDVLRDQDVVPEVRPRVQDNGTAGAGSTNGASDPPGATLFIVTIVAADDGAAMITNAIINHPARNNATPGI